MPGSRLLVVTEPYRLEAATLASALEVAKRLLVAPGPAPVQAATRAVLATLHTSRAQYHAHTDSALLRHATTVLRNPAELDVEQFHHLGAIAVLRSKNLVNFAECQGEARGRSEECQRFMELLTAAFWRLLAEIPANCESGSLGQPGLNHVEATVQWLVEILHAITLVDMDTAGYAATHYIQLLLCPDQRVSFPARSALVRAVRPRPRRRRLLPLPPTLGPQQWGSPRVATLGEASGSRTATSACC